MPTCDLCGNPLPQAQASALFDALCPACWALQQPPMDESPAQIAYDVQLARLQIRGHLRWAHHHEDTQRQHPTPALHERGERAKPAACLFWTGQRHGVPPYAILAPVLACILCSLEVPMLTVVLVALGLVVVLGLALVVWDCWGTPRW